MSFEKIVRQNVKRIILEEIENLSIKAEIRKAVASVTTKEQLAQKLDETIDSYFRSAIGEKSVEEYIRTKLNDKIQAVAKEQIEELIGSITFNRMVNDRLRESLLREMERNLNGNYNITCSVAPKGD